MAFERIVPLGIALIVIGFLLVFLGSLFATVQGSKESKSQVKSAGVIFIGPFPIGWASDKSMFYTLMAIVILMILFWFIILRR